MNYLNAPINQRRPLFIKGRRLEILRFREPALELKLINQSIQLFPLRRLSQVCLIGQVECNISVLFTVAARGIPVHLFTGKGKAMSKLLPAMQNQDVLEDTLETALVQPQMMKHIELMVANFVLHSASIIPGRNNVGLSYHNFIHSMAALSAKRGKKVKHNADMWFLGMLNNTWANVQNSMCLPANGPLSVKLETWVNQLLAPWGHYLTYQLIIEKQQTATADNVVHCFKSCEPIIDLMLRRFIYRLELMCTKPSLCRELINI
jgi:hypothetical protein